MKANALLIDPKQKQKLLSYKYIYTNLFSRFVLKRESLEESEIINANTLVFIRIYIASI